MNLSTYTLMTLHQDSELVLCRRLGTAEFDIRSTIRPRNDAGVAAPGRRSRPDAGTRIVPVRARHLTGVRIGAPLSFTRNTSNLAGAVWLAFRPTTCTSSGPS